MRRPPLWLLALFLVPSLRSWADEAADPSVPSRGRFASAGSAASEDLATAELERRLKRLKQIFSGSSRLDVPIRSLFFVDLNDENAVSARVRAIDKRLAVLRPLVKRSGRARTSTTSTSTVTRARSPHLLELRALQLERNFLQQNPDLRKAQIEADEARRLFLIEQQKAKKRAAHAQQEAKRAQAERLEALRRAEEARSQALKEIQNHRAYVAQSRTELAKKQRSLSMARDAHSERNARFFGQIRQLLVQEQQTTTGTVTLALLGEVRRKLKDSLDALAAALQSYREPISVAEHRDRDGLRALRTHLFGDDLEAARNLERSLAELRSRAKELKAQEERGRLLAVEAWHAQVTALAGARSRLMRRVPESGRRELMGFSRQALRGLSLEVRTLRISFEAHATLLVKNLGGLWRSWHRTVSKEAFWWMLFRIILILVFAFWVRSLGPSLQEWFHRYELGRVRSFGWLRRIGFAQRVFARFFPLFLFLETVFAIEYVLGDYGESVEIHIVFTIAKWVGYYWLVHRALTGITVWLARRRHAIIGRAVLARIHSSTLLVARALLLSGFLGSVALEVFGYGVLYSIVRLVLLGALFLVGLVLIRRWRGPIARSYLKNWPEGRLARLVEASQDQSYSLLVVSAAFIYVAAKALAILGRELLLKPEEIRKALAFVFRKRLERRAEELGQWEGKIEILPESLLLAFTQRPLPDDSLRIDRFIGLDKFQRDFDLWKSGRAKGSFLVRGARGFGKTTWLHRAAKECGDFEATHVSLKRSDVGWDGVKEQLGEGLKMELGTTVDRAARALNSGPRRMVVLDDIQNLFLREIGGFDGLDGLMHLIEQTGQNIFWLSSIDDFSWRHISSAWPKRLHFRSEQFLAAWSEGQIRDLLMARAAAAGVIHEFEDLTTSQDMATSGGELVRASEAYVRLIWDYADGCPLVAVHFWVRSLAPAGDKMVRVRLFKAPEAGRLERVPQEVRFLYAALAMHENLSVGEAARVLRVSESYCEAMLVRGYEEGYLARHQDRGRYTLNVHWYRAIVRFLKRKHVL